MVGTDLPGAVKPQAIGGYAYMEKHIDHHRRVNTVSFIEELPTVLQTADSATSQARARQLALECEDSPKQQFKVVSQYIRAVGMDKINPPTYISASTPTRKLWPHHARKSVNIQRQRSTTSAWRTPAKLQHLEVATAAPVLKTAYDHCDCLERISGTLT